MRKGIVLLVVIAIAGGLGPLAVSASAGEYHLTSPSVLASCLTLPELHRARQSLAQHALEGDSPVSTYRAEVFAIQAADAAESSDCVAGLRTSVLTNVRGRTLIRLADGDDTTVGGPGADVFGGGSGCGCAGGGDIAFGDPATGVLLDANGNLVGASPSVARSIAKGIYGSALAAGMLGNGPLAAALAAQAAVLNAAADAAERAQSGSSGSGGGSDGCANNK